MLRKSPAAKAPIPVLAVTMGDVNGIGPELIAKVAARRDELGAVRLIVFGDPSAYQAARATVRSAPEPVVIAETAGAEEVDEGLAFLPGGAPAPTYEPGTLHANAGAAAMAWLAGAVDAVRDGAADALVTCPINKAGIRAAGYTVMGHTDFIAERLDAPDYRMCLFAGPMRVVHNTGHLPLRAALDAITTARVGDTIRIGHDALQRMGLQRQRIAVAGLNPHAGEGGLLGNEETETVLPAVEQAQRDGINCHGPISPDAVFAHMHEGAYDMVIALYHDQGHIPLKLIARDEGVNVTLGIPIVRTSVDHGTAYDIAGQGVAKEDSLMAAIRLAADLAQLPREAQS